ncbi:MAG TPA: CocE/NonD family hydrolase [Chloroflexota bacterium]
MRIEFDVPARMRDGVTLRADVYRPTARGPWPTLLVRTPYGKHIAAETVWNGLDPVQAARRGFIVVVQDARGRFASEGEWSPFRYEREDGYDSVKWAAALPGSNGRVGMYGGSYCGNTQWLTAIAKPPSLAAISPLMTWSEPMDGLFARGGALELGLALPWALLQGFDYLGRVCGHTVDLERRVAALIDEWDRLDQRGYWELPVGELAALTRHEVPELGSVAARGDAEISKRCRVEGYSPIEIPTFHTAGWYDIFLQGTLDNFAATSSQGGDARLVVGPWSHDRFVDPIGEQVFGMVSARDGIPVHPHGDWNDYQLAWFRSHLTTESEVKLPEALVRLFVMGRNEWSDEASWPPRDVRAETWFLRTDGRLTLATPSAGEGYSRFTYDPADPAPTVGGHTMMWSGFPAGPMDQRAVEKRRDVLVFTSEPLELDVEVCGRIRISLNAQSSAPSTDWVARLCDVHPDGRSVNLCDGILRVSDGADQLRTHEIDLWSTTNVFLYGHRIRVAVTSSSFPRWDRNLNTGDQGRGEYIIAEQHVYHDASCPSGITLPVRT